MAIREDRLRKQDEIVVGNIEDKAALKNPIARRLVAGFDSALLRLTAAADPSSIHEAGCGEGRVASLLARTFRVPVRATDFSTALIAELQDRTTSSDRPNITFVQRSIYDLKTPEDTADLIVCCEVLEHLDEPTQALETLRLLGARHYLFSVPREPLWCMLNLARGRYLKHWGNTPGHLQHWSAYGFVRMLRNNGFAIRETCHPLPWTMVLASLSADAPRSS